MAKYFLTKKAVKDLSDIWKYTKYKWSEEQADKYYHFLLDSCQELADNPSIAKQYDMVREGLMGLRANRHVIFFRVLSKSEIEILRILHGMMGSKNKNVKALTLSRLILFFPRESTNTKKEA